MAVREIARKSTVAIMGGKFSLQEEYYDSKFRGLCRFGLSTRPVVPCLRLYCFACTKASRVVGSLHQSLIPYLKTAANTSKPQMTYSVSSPFILS